METLLWKYICDCDSNNMLITWCESSRDDFNRYVALHINCEAKAHPTIGENNEKYGKSLASFVMNAEITFNRTHPSFIYLVISTAKLWATIDR